MNGILKVTPSELKAKSGEFETIRGAIWNLIQEMNNKVNGLNATWTGGAAEAYRTSYAGLKDDMERLNRMIREHVTDLVEMADLYAQAEDRTQQTAAALPKDAIS